jgi:hypothetical protein
VSAIELFCSRSQVSTGPVQLMPPSEFVRGRPYSLNQQRQSKLPQGGGSSLF